MADLKSIFDGIKKTFNVRKTIEFGDYNIKIEMEPLTSLEENKVIEACKSLDGIGYIEGLKKHSLAYSIRKINDIDLDFTEMEIIKEDGTKEMVSKYLFLIKHLEEMPSGLSDLLFEAFTDMVAEADNRIREKAKFNRFLVKSNPVQADSPKNFKEVMETNAGLTETELLNKQVKEELETADRALAKAEQDQKSR